MEREDINRITEELEDLLAGKKRPGRRPRGRLPGA